jgi:sporulation protein YlmC with PRC-barrel domain
MRTTFFAAAMVLMAAPAYAQPATAFVTAQGIGEWRANNYIGQPVVNASGEKIGDVNDLIFDKSGRITTVIVGIGGFLGMGEKNVGMGYETLTYTDKDGQRLVTVPLTKEALLAAPSYVYTEKTSLDKMREKAGDMAHQASEKAGELKDQAVKKIEEYRSGEPAKTQ